MIISRRILLAGACSTCICGAQAQSGSRIPNPADFESGDFVWPKKPGVFIPYRYSSEESADEDRERWNQEKSEFLEKARADQIPEGQQITKEIEGLGYNEFRARYLRNQEPNQVVTFSSSGVAAVGHVGIIELDAQDRPWIIEALSPQGVVRGPYSSWINARPGEIVWHGRLKSVNRQDRARVAAEANNYISKPYDFWNFNLADTSGFYCSKLVWLCVMKALNFAVDENPNPLRTIWLSPKQVLYSPKIDRLLDPGEYATD
jgi:Permuted papain-like amidase enzyme, YaeF/YiiX, C92 family